MGLDIKETGKKIRQYRKIAGLTQEELAQKVGISIMSVRRYESGERIVPRERIESIATVLGVSPYSLYTFDQASDAIFEDINNADKYKARITELMEKVTTEGLRIGKDVFEAIAGNPKYQWYDEPIPLVDEDTTTATDGPEPPPEGE